MEVTLGPADGRVRIKLRKQPFSKAYPTYFELRMKEEDQNPSPRECTRYFVGTRMTFGVEVTLKQGFIYGEYDGVVVKILDKSSGTILRKAFWPKTIVKLDGKGMLKKDHTETYVTMDDTVLGGELRTGNSMVLLPLDDGMSIYFQEFHRDIR
jgi:hypothetical protein